MKKYIFTLFAIVIPVTVVIFYYGLYNETDSFSIQCSLYRSTGLLCPGCGGQRAFHHLLHGNFLTALQYNAIFTLGLPVLLYLYFVLIKVYIFNNTKYLNSFIFSSRFGYGLLAVLFIYFILRNIPFVPFTYLSLSQ